ncbi:MAG TPA: HAD hydrolase-like protein, partial [Terracidiphilus sp.]
MVRIHRPIPLEQLKLLVFDLDGTLIDSAQDLCNSVNATLAHVGRAPLADEVVASYIGDGAKLLIRR